MVPHIIAVTVKHYSGCTPNIFSSIAHVQHCNIITMFYVGLAITKCVYIYIYIYIHTTYYADIAEQSHDTRLDEWNTKTLYNIMYQLHIVVYDTITSDVNYNMYTIVAITNNSVNMCIV